MKKNENDNLVAHFHSLCEEKKLKDEIAKQQKRLWLRTKIHEIIDKMLSCKLHLHWGRNPLVFVYDFELVK